MTSAPYTEGIKYAGSKLKLLPYICDIVRELPVKTALDAFSGTTRVSQAFVQMGLDTTANDISEWSEVFGNCYLIADKPDSFYQEIIDELNSLDGFDGWFTEHYGGDGSDAGGKMPFQRHNTRKLDAIRERIDGYGLEYPDKCVLLTSLIRALDSVDNTLGHFSSYLSGWSERSFRTMLLKCPVRPEHKTRNMVLKGEALDAVKLPSDLVYLDPPYGSNNEKMPSSRIRYGSYYHLWKTVILNDKPDLFGKVNRREDSRDASTVSVYEEYRKNEQTGKFKAMEAIDALIAEADTRYVLLSYSSGGRATRQELSDIINSHGRLVTAREINYRKNVMASFHWTGEWLNDYGDNKEYLLLMEK